MRSRSSLDVKAITIALVLLASPPATAQPTADSDADAIVPFKINVDDDVLEDLRLRLERARFPDQLNGVGWDYGTDVGYLRELVEYWRTDFDWRKQERMLNEFPQFRTEIDGLKIHFIHVRSKHPGAMPLLLAHGWPDSVFGFQKVIGKLTDPEAHGGRAQDAFHVVAPCLPGFGFSGKPSRKGTSNTFSCMIGP